MQIEVGRHRQFAVKREGLRHIADLLACLQVAGIDGLAEQPGDAIAGGQETGQHFHGGRLAAAVRAEETENLAALDLEADAIHRREIAKAL